MTKYAKIEKGVVVQIQFSKQKGFVEVEDSVFAGMVKTKTGEFVVPKDENSSELEKQERISELEKNLRETDFKVLPDYDKPNDEIKKQRQEWRDELRKLQ